LVGLFVLLTIATGVIVEGESDEGIFVAEAETVELRGTEGSPLGLESKSGVAVGITVAVAETVELTVSEDELVVGAVWAP